MPWATSLQFYYVVADPKEAEEHIYTKFSKCNSFQLTSDFTHYGKYWKVRKVGIGKGSQVTHHVVAMENVAE